MLGLVGQRWGAGGAGYAVAVWRRRREFSGRVGVGGSVAFGVEPAGGCFAEQRSRRVAARWAAGCGADGGRAQAQLAELGDVGPALPGSRTGRAGSKVARRQRLVAGGHRRQQGVGLAAAQVVEGGGSPPRAALGLPEVDAELDKLGRGSGSDRRILGLWRADAGGRYRSAGWHDKRRAPESETCAASSGGARRCLKSFSTGKPGSLPISGDSCES